MMKGSKGTKMPRGDKNQILEFEIPDYPLSTQQNIASILSSLDDKIELNNKINAELEAMAKTIYDYWFVQFNFPAEASTKVNGKNIAGKPYKSSGGKMVWSEDLKREVPEGWEIKSLLEIADFTNGLACQKFRPDNIVDSLPVIKIKEMNDGISANTELVRSDIPEKVIVNNGDVLFSWSASLDVKIWTQGKGGLNQHIFKVTSKKYPRTFYYYEVLAYLEHFKMIAELRKTTMGHITQDHLKQSRIAVPPDKLIRLLHNKLNYFIELVIKNKEQNQQLSQLRNWLLPMLMNGQVSAGQAFKQVQEALGATAEPPANYRNPAKENISDDELLQLYFMVLNIAKHKGKKEEAFLAEVKMEKSCHLGEYNIPQLKFNRRPVKEKHGPVDFERLNKLIAYAADNDIFYYNKSASYEKYTEGTNFHSYFSEAISAFRPFIKQVNHLLQLLFSLDTNTIDLYATTFAAWNNLIILKKPTTEKDIAKEARWHELKKRFTDNDIKEAIQFLKANNLAPAGTGCLVKDKRT
jgi:type I restriction enzyme, S subunit